MREYLQEHEKEVVDFMDVLYDVEWNRKILDRENREEAKQEGLDERSIQVYNNCLDRGMSENDAIALSEISEKALAVAREQRRNRQS